VLIAITMGLLAALAVAAAAAILTLGLLQRENASYLGISVRSVLVAEQLEALLHRVPSTPPGGAEEQAVARLLAESTAMIQSAEERETVRQLRAAIDDLLAMRAGGATGPALRAALDRAVAADEALLQVNLAQAAAADVRAEEGASLWAGLAIAAAAAVVLTMGFLLVWARRRLLAPLEELRRGIERLALGESGVRVPEDAPTELREAALTLNAMARLLDEQAQERMAFLSRVGESLEGPLGHMRTALDQLLLGAQAGPAGGAATEAGAQHLRSLQVQAGALERVVREFLDGARAEDGHIALVPEPLDLREVVRDSVDLLRGLLPAQELDLAAPQEEVRVIADPDRLAQALNAGLLWSLQSVPPGARLEVALTVEQGAAGCPEARVTVRGRSGASVRFEDLFNTLQHLDDQLRAVPGALLGLRTARKLAAALGGSLEAADGLLVLALPLLVEPRGQPGLALHPEPVPGTR
jgi:HAMP domain-containing protein